MFNGDLLKANGAHEKREKKSSNLMNGIVITEHKEMYVTTFSVFLTLFIHSFMLYAVYIYAL